MLGFNISIYKLQNGAQRPQAMDPPTARRLAVWQTGTSGLHWIDDLVKKGQAVHLGGWAYPEEWAATVEHVRPVILEGPPEANTVWGYDPGDILLDGWCGKTTIDRDALLKCSPDEWVLIRSWDES